MRLRCDERRSRRSIPAHHTPATCCVDDISSAHGHYHMLCRRPGAPESVGGEGEGAVRGQWAQQQQSDVGGGQGRHERRGEVHLPGLPALAPRRQVGRLAGAGSTRNRPGLSAWCLPLSEAPSTVPPSLLRAGSVRRLAAVRDGLWVLIKVKMAG
jgi:hypothetical protein